MVELEEGLRGWLLVAGHYGDFEALARELGNMKKEGIIEFCGNHFEIKMELC